MSIQEGMKGNMQDEVSEMKKQAAVFTVEIQYMKDGLDKMNDKIDSLRLDLIRELKDLRNVFEDNLQRTKEHFVRKEEFQPVKNLVYGTAGSILLAFVGAILALILKS